MGIFTRIKNIISADFNDALDRVEDPVAMLKQHLREMEEEIQRAHASLANQLYIEKKYEAILKETSDVVQKRKRQAELAVERKEDDIARLAIQDKLENEKKLNAYQEQYQAIKNQTDLLCGHIDSLREKYKEFETQKLALISRMNVAQATSDISNISASTNPEIATKGFQRVEDHMFKLEAKTAANQYGMKQSTFFEGSILDADVEKELANLKASKTTVEQQA
ncbi:PspA/IM30 family protein [Mesobacillus maritimus]|uniref:PspA/IM30 family protein n=1 Tax=Mesobacillus maritimus TaxID=1643336 RepID=UPI002040FE76|nr:PspA/IM30 family protein [Mesobacillus maritimus]MCM3587542.1 PspA/IM30 family protein [Mesobacillus maritimus]